MYCDAASFPNKGIRPAQAARTYTNHPILLKPSVDDTNDVLDTEDRVNTRDVFYSAFID
jgi:hypothetical protein